MILQTFIRHWDDGHGQVERPREEMVFHFPHYQSADGPHSALILGNLKLLKYYEDNRLALFDLSRDIREQNDLSRQLPKDTAKLHGLLNDYLADVGAMLPVPNPQFDPANAPSLTQRGPQRGGGRSRRARGGDRKKRENPQQ